MGGARQRFGSSLTQTCSMITGHREHGADAVGLTSAGAEFSLVTLVAAAHAAASVVNDQALHGRVAVVMTGAKLRRLSVDAGVVLTAVGRLAVLRVAVSASDAAVVLAASRRRAVVGCAVRRCALPKLVADGADGAFIVLLAVDATPELFARRDHAVQLTWAIISAHTRR